MLAALAAGRALLPDAVGGWQALRVACVRQINVSATAAAADASAPQQQHEQQPGGLSAFLDAEPERDKDGNPLQVTYGE